MRLSGKADEGDLVFRHRGKFHVHEYKNVKTWSYATLLGYLAEAKAECGNFLSSRMLVPGKGHYAVVLKQHGKGWSDGIVLMPVSEYLRLLDSDG